METNTLKLYRSSLEQFLNERGQTLSDEDRALLAEILALLESLITSLDATETGKRSSKKLGSMLLRFFREYLYSGFDFDED